LFLAREYESATAAFEELGDFKDSGKLALASWNLKKANEFLDAGDFRKAQEYFDKQDVQNIADWIEYAEALQKRSQDTMNDINSSVESHLNFEVLVDYVLEFDYISNFPKDGH
jgi:tetratricopeptide (TPR) repeat protein